MLFQAEFHAMEEMPEHLRLYFENLTQAREEDLSYIRDKYQAVLEKIKEIDALLNEKTTGWKTGRMNKVDLTILRLAVYEILWDSQKTGPEIYKCVRDNLFNIFRCVKLILPQLQV